MQAKLNFLKAIKQINSHQAFGTSDSSEINGVYCRYIFCSLYYQLMLQNATEISPQTFEIVK